VKPPVPALWRLHFDTGSLDRRLQGPNGRKAEIIAEFRLPRQSHVAALNRKPKPFRRNGLAVAAEFGGIDSTEKTAVQCKVGIEGSREAQIQFRIAIELVLAENTGGERAGRIPIFAVIADTPGQGPTLKKPNAIDGVSVGQCVCRDKTCERP